MIRARASLSTAGCPRKGFRTLAIRMSSIIIRASDVVTGATRKTTSSISSVKIPPRPNITQGPNWTSRVSPQTSSRSPLTISWTSRASQPGIASSRRASSRTSASDFRFSAMAPTSVLCWSFSPAALSTTGYPISRAAFRAPASSGTRVSRLTGTPKPAKKRLASCSFRADFPDFTASSIRFIGEFFPFFSRSS